MCRAARYVILKLNLCAAKRLSGTLGNKGASARQKLPAYDCTTNSRVCNCAGKKETGRAAAAPHLCRRRGIGFDAHMTFRDLHLTAPLLKAVAEAGYTQPSPIQQQAIPPVLAGRDLLGCAQTGTGKTAAFALPILQRLSGEKPKEGRPIRALVLTPTRELAIQIDDSFAAYGKHLALRHSVIFGGVGQGPQVAELKAGVDVLTATPGRLNDLIGQGYIDLRQLRVFVLDEADRMLDMGFIHDVKKVLRQLPDKRQTLLFSATMPPEIEALAAGMLHRPAKVMVAPPATTVERIRQSVCRVEKGDKKHLLAHLLRQLEVESALVFTRTKHGADRVVRELSRAGIAAMAIHGNKSQTARQRALGAFKNGSLKVLVATDIAARGIDVTGLSHVFNYDLPNVPETYVHRIGRTGRAGRDGIAISFCSAEEEGCLRDIEKTTRQEIPEQNHPWAYGAKAGQGGQVAAQPAAKPAQQERRPAPVQEAPRERKETIKMDQEKTMRPNAAAEPGGAPRRRRRRGGRRHGKVKSEAAALAAQREKGGAELQAPAPHTAKRAGKGAAASKEGGRHAGKTGGGRENQQQAPHGKKSRGREPLPDRLAQRVRVRELAQAEFSAEDNSIQLISRRPPAVKFSSFEEYMKAHGKDGVEGDLPGEDGSAEE